jgi:hypothetical protein
VVAVKVTKILLARDLWPIKMDDVQVQLVINQGDSNHVTEPLTNRKGLLGVCSFLFPEKALS